MSVTRVLSPVKVLGAALVGLTAFAASIPAQADFGDDSRNMIYDLQGRVTVLENGSNQAINSVAGTVTANNTEQTNKNAEQDLKISANKTTNDQQDAKIATATNTANSASSAATQAQRAADAAAATANTATTKNNQQDAAINGLTNTVNNNKADQTAKDKLQDGIIASNKTNTDNLIASNKTEQAATDAAQNKVINDNKAAQSLTDIAQNKVINDNKTASDAKDRTQDTTIAQNKAASDSKDATQDALIVGIPLKSIRQIRRSLQTKQLRPRKIVPKTALLPLIRQISQHQQAKILSKTRLSQQTKSQLIEKTKLKIVRFVISSKKLRLTTSR